MNGAPNWISDPSDDTAKRGASVCYVVTDIETDGPAPGKNSMLSFACVAVDEQGVAFDQFEACLAPLDGAAPNPDTLAWLKSQPAVWADLTRNPRPAAEAMATFANWVRQLPHEPVFTSHPLVFDGYWIDWYMRTFLGLRMDRGPYGGERLFFGAGLDLPSLIMGVMGWPYARCRRPNYPPEWFGGHPHSHRAIDDASGYAAILTEMLRRIRPANRYQSDLLRRVHPRPHTGIESAARPRSASLHGDRDHAAMAGHRDLARPAQHCAPLLGLLLAGRAGADALSARPRPRDEGQARA